MGFFLTGDKVFYFSIQLHPHMFKQPKPIIGMLHCPALPGSPNYANSLENIYQFVLNDASALAAGGVDALMIENYGDLPFFPDSVPSPTVACLASIARKIKKSFSLPLGINVLRNDGISALAIANAARAQFVRINILTGARLTDQGIINGKAHEVLRFRNRIGARTVQIFADISVKYSSPLAPRHLKNEIEETVHRSGADGLIVSGEATGKPVNLKTLQEVKTFCEGKPIWIGSGANSQNILELSQYADGFIIGSAFKPSLDAPIEVNRVKEICSKLNRSAQ